MHRGKFELLVERSLISEKHEDHFIICVVVTDILHGYGCLNKVKESFSGLSFGESDIYSCVDDGCWQ